MYLKTVLSLERPTCMAVGVASSGKPAVSVMCVLTTHIHTLPCVFVYTDTQTQQSDSGNPVAAVAEGVRGTTHLRGISACRSRDAH